MVCSIYVSGVGYLELGVDYTPGLPNPIQGGQFILTGRLPENIPPGRHIIRCRDSDGNVDKVVYQVQPSDEQILEEIEKQVNDRINQQADAKKTNQVGQSIGTADSNAFFASAGTVTTIPTLGGPTNVAEGINAANPAQVVGDSTRSSGTEHAFLWSPGGNPVDLGTPGGAAGTSSAAAINERGQVAGAFQASGEDFHAVLWNPEAPNGTTGLWFDLGTLGGDRSQAGGINDEGQVAGSADLADGSTHAFLWTPSQPNGTTGQMQDLGTLGGDSFGTAVNSSGEVAGFSLTTATGTGQAFIYSGGHLNGIGTLGGKNAGANDINDLGQVVGSSLLADNTTRHAFLYSEGEMFDLNKTIPSSAGWVLQSARGINDVGQIAGVGLHNGKQEAFVLEPQTVLGPLTAQVPITPAAVASQHGAPASLAAPTSTVVLGGTVQWQNAGPGDSTVVDASGMGLFGSPSLKPGGGYAFEFDAAGTYRYTASGGGTVEVSPEVAPTNGKVSTLFQIYWCFCHAPKGFVFDVQIKRPGEKSFKNWITGTTKGETPAKPGHGTGTYSFRARLRKTSNGKHSDWSPPVSVRVS